MPLEVYSANKVVDNKVKPELANLKGKSVVVTGGSSGFGEAYVRAYTSAGAFVTFGDIDEKRGKEIEAEVKPHGLFVKCDVRSWDDQLQMFKQAIAASPANIIDIVIANAGVSGHDDLFNPEDAGKEPTKPDLYMVDINLTGVLYTMKLAMHYFRGQAEEPGRDRCLILKSSLAGILDATGAYQYSAAKYALRGLVRAARRACSPEGIRINYIAPWYVRTAILPPSLVELLTSMGIRFAEVEDVVAAALRISCDNSINGRGFAVVPRYNLAEGYLDANVDDFEEGTLWYNLQNNVGPLVEQAISVETGEQL